MTDAIVVGILLILHMIVCAAIYRGYISGKLQVQKIYMPVVIMVPLWGALCVLILNVRKIAEFGDRKGIETEEVWAEEDMYKIFSTNAVQPDKEVVPLEEALVMNTPSQRRNLIMDVLYDNPEEYMDLLNEARMNDDVEVVHYATTAMAEISKKYDLKLQRMEHIYAKHPDNVEVLNKYCVLLRKYISLKLAQGPSLIMLRKRYEELLEKKAQTGMTKKDWIYKVENEFELKEYEKAGESVNMMEKMYPNREETWLLKIKYHALRHEGRKIRLLIKEIEEKDIYFSKKGQQILEFWKRKEGAKRNEIKRTSI